MDYRTQAWTAFTVRRTRRYSVFEARGTPTGQLHENLGVRPPRWQTNSCVARLLGGVNEDERPDTLPNLARLSTKPIENVAASPTSTEPVHPFLHEL